MVVCRFYMQGSCKFGKNCRFEHPNTSSQQQGLLRPSQFEGQSAWGSSPLGNQQGTVQDNLGHNVNEIMTTIKQEMIIWRDSKMWPFSSFGYAKCVSSLPGLEDLSMEEVRMKAYEANKNGTNKEYQQWLASMILDYQLKKTQLETIDGATRAHLMQFITDEASKSQTTAPDISKPSLFSTTTGTSPLAGNKRSPFGGSVFGGTAGAIGASATLPVSSTQNPSVFGNTTPAPVASLFGGSTTQKPSVFGGSTNQSSNAVFGNNQTSPDFGSTIGASSIFGNTATTAVFGSASHSVFGSAGNVGSNSVFGAAQNSGAGEPGFGGGASQGVFGTSVFGNVTMQSSAGSFDPQPQTSIFSNNQLQNNSNISQQSAFGGQPQSSQPNQTMSGFGEVQMSQSAFGSVDQSGQSAFSKLGQAQNEQGNQGLGNSSQINQPSFTNVQTSQSAVSTFGHVTPSTQSADSTTANVTSQPALSSFSFAANTNLPIQQTAPVLSEPVGLFGKAASQTGAIPTQNAAIDLTIYTPLDQLTKLEREQFEADVFTPGCLPIRPPPIELC